MKDRTIPLASERKKIMFYDSEEKQTRFRIRCQHDGITQSQFLRMMITGYIENDPLIFDFLKKQKEKFNIQGKGKRNKISQIKKAETENIKKFSLNNNEIEDIFDIIEMETDI
jgi:antitoxin component of RelBE/YafQ-DinJ toxin-antitoxin module